MENQLTFAGFPVEFKMEGDEVLVICKGITGTFTQGHAFLNKKKSTRHYFGDCIIRSYPNKIVKIDCLKDTLEQFTLIYEQALKLKDGDINKKKEKKNGN